MGYMVRDTKLIGRDVLWVKETDSTNNMMKRLIIDETTLEAESGYGSIYEGTAREGLMIVSDYQSSGRGRSGHNWVAPPGSCVAISVLLKPDIADDKVHAITLIAAMAVVRAIEQLSGLRTQIKWPNDVISGGKKICGILTELLVERGEKNVIVGVGINLSQSDFPAELADKATSILLETGREYMAEEVVEHFARAFEEYYLKFMSTCDMTLLMDEYESRLINRGAEVRVMDPAGEYSGVAKGINESGALIVDTGVGIKVVDAGEVSVRGIYGYV